MKTHHCQVSDKPKSAVVNWNDVGAIVLI